MYRTDSWTLWEKERVGCSERTASKHVYYLGWNRSPAQVGCKRQVLGAGTLGRPRGMGWRGKWEGGSGWWTHVNPWLIHANVWQKPLQYCKVISLQLIKINGKKKKKEPLMFAELAQTAGRVVCWQVQGSAAWGPPNPIPKLGHLSCHLLPALCSEDRTIVRVRNAISSNLQPYSYFVLAAFIRFLLMQVGTGEMDPGWPGALYWWSQPDAKWAPICAFWTGCSGLTGAQHIRHNNQLKQQRSRNRKGIQA